MKSTARKSKDTVSATETKSQKRRWNVVLDKPVQHVKAANDAQSMSAPHIGVADLELAALDPTPLPWRMELERHFETSLAGLSVYQGPEVDAALKADDAQAAVHGEAVLLASNVEKPVVAHEIAHVLQQRGLHGTPDPRQAEVEALHAERQVETGLPVAAPTAALTVGAVAMRDTSALEDQPLVQGTDREAAETFQSGTQATNPDTVQTTSSEEPGADEAQAQEQTDVLGAVETGEALPDDPIPTFELPPMPDVEADENAAAAAQDEAETALEGAAEADGLVEAFKDAPPSVKALHHDQLNGQISEMAEADQTEFEANMPEFLAEMSGTDDLTDPEPVATPEAREAQLEDGAAPPPPDPQVDPTPDPGTPDLNAEISSFLSRMFSVGDAGGLGQAFTRVSTSDNDVDTSAGARPDVPLEGQTDPQRVEDQDSTARDDARASRAEATRAVTEGPGPEQVELTEMREDFAMEARERPVVDAVEGPVEGAAGFRDKELDGEVVALFDAHHNDAMSASLEDASAEASSAVETRETERDAELAQAEEERARLNAEADEDQRAEVSTQRQAVQDARQHAVDEQQAHVDEMESQADLDRQEAESTIDTEVSEAETQVETDFAQAETDAQTEVDNGERDAEEERAARERESENQSWWDRATDWVAEQFDKLTKFINDIFDAVRAAVKDIIDAVKDAAIALIDAAVSVITSAIEALGEALKAAVNALLAEHFPALAEALNNAIDAAVDQATAYVEAVGEVLKAGVSALLDALAAGIDAILGAFQAAINAVLAIARAALTGDWDELARLVLEPILMALGIEPAAFYQMIERAMQALDVIIDDPLGFLSNLVDAVVGGIRQFGSKLAEHLQAGVIGWLTGALGGDIQIPERFDLMGVLDLARQILGLTVDMIRRIAVRILGEEAVEKIEFFMGYVVELVTGGFSALWDKIMGDLTALKDMVLDGIKDFLMERLVMAAISWLASLFNPIGALIKLIMTIWNFIMFLKDQLARIIQVVQTVVSTMWEIATGVLQPAIDGIEGVLARLLPIVIDLLARLLGLGNVAGKVQEIIGRVRQRIEDAIVNLIQRVLARFTGRGRDGAAEEQDDAEAQMEPMTFGNEEERHTLYLEERNGNTVPMMRSDPLPIETWLKSFLGDGAETYFRETKGLVRESTIREKVDGVQKEVRKALGIEETLDEESDKEDATTPQLARTGGSLTRSLNKIMGYLGSGTSMMAEMFEPYVAEMNPELRDQMRLILKSFSDDEAKENREKTWAQMEDVLWNYDKLPAIWKTPVSSSGLLRRNTTTKSAYLEAVIAYVNGYDADVLKVEDEDINKLLRNYLTERLNKPASAKAIFEVLLTSDGKDMQEVVAAVKGEVDQAANDFKQSGVDGPDVEIKDDIKPSTIFARMREYVDKDLTAGPRTYTVWDSNVSGDGASNGPFNLLTMISDSSKTSRQSENSKWVGNAIRNAGNHVRPHEWIKASTADMVLRHASNAVESGNGKAIKAASELIDFQESVRTPTTKLIFKPGQDFSAHQKVQYKAKQHRESDQYKDKPMSQIPKNLRDTWYPKSGPKEGDTVGVLQAHSGGLYAFAKSPGFENALRPQAVGSTTWHNVLEDEVDTAAAKLMQGPAYSAAALRTAIVSHYETTIWKGESPFSSSGKHFPNYYRRDSESSRITYSALKSEFQNNFKTVKDDLTRMLGGVVDG
ncbi:MAG: DUF4157 domain-containing protein [Pseudomonadota bacterium]